MEAEEKDVDFERRKHQAGEVGTGPEKEMGSGGWYSVKDWIASTIAQATQRNSPTSLREYAGALRNRRRRILAATRLPGPASQKKHVGN